MLNLLDSNIVNAIDYIYKHIFTHISHPKLLATVFQNLDEIKKNRAVQYIAHNTLDDKLYPESNFDGRREIYNCAWIV